MTSQASTEFKNSAIKLYLKMNSIRTVCNLLDIKKSTPYNFEELKLTIDRIIKKKIKEEHLKNYFNYLFIQAKDFIEKN
jgi:transposase-like protein